jgi:hypothetical protein
MSENIENTQETEQNEPEVVETSTVDNTQPVITNSDDAEKALRQAKENQAQQKTQKTTPKPAPVVDYKKQYEELQKGFGKQGNELGEYRKKLAELENIKQYLPVLEQYKQQMEAQKQAEMAQRFQTDPVALAREIARQEMQQMMGPVQEMQVKQEASDIDSYLRQNLGDKYETYAPMMGDVLEEFSKSDPNIAQYMARNPQVLYLFARGLEGHNSDKAQSTNVNAGQQRQQAQKAAAMGVSKGSQVSSKPSENWENMDSKQLTEFMKAKGIIAPKNL